MPNAELQPSNDEVTLAELVNRVLDRGVHISGEVVISVADVDLLSLGLDLLLSSVERRHGGLAAQVAAEAEAGRIEATPGRSGPGMGRGERE